MAKLSDWLDGELKQRAWSYSELARRAGISQSSVSNVLLQKQTPGLEFCKGVAKALDTPVDQVLRLAGHMPPLPPPVAEEQEAVRLLRTLSEQMRSVALSILRTLQGTGSEPEGAGASAEGGPRTLSERLAWEIARDLETMPPEDQRKVFELMKRLRGDRGAEEADRVPLGADS